MFDFDKLDEEKKISNLRKGLLSKGFTDIPPIEKFSKMNFIPIVPRSSVNAKVNNLEPDSNMIIESKYEKPAKNKLREIFNSYMVKFETICKEVIEMKYSNIFNEISHFLLFMEFCNDLVLRTLVINTDQNANDFFHSMDDYFYTKNGNKGKFEEEEKKKVVLVSEEKFRDLKSLFKYLNICEDGLELENSNANEKFQRLIVLREIQKIDKINFNLLIGRLIDYNENPNRIYTNIIVFDVSYDPRGLYEKIKPNILCKMTFSNVENIPSRNIYQEVLYKFIYENTNSLFIPNSTNLKKIVEYVNNHQISIKSFQHYFKFLLIDFFLIESWSRDEYLIYCDKIIDEKEATTEILYKNFSNELKKIYGKKSIMYNKNDINYLINSYQSEKSNRELFFTFYKFLEELMLYLNTFSKSKMYNVDKFQFFFDFIQLGSTPDKVAAYRTNLIKISLERIENKDYVEITKNIIIEQFKQFMEQSDFLNKISEDNYSNSNAINDKTNLLNFIKKLENLITDTGGKEYSKLFNKGKTRSNLNNSMDIDLPPIMSNKEFLDKLLKLFNEDLFTLDFFSYMDKNENRKMNLKDPRLIINTAGKYIVFHEIVNPSLNSIVIDVLYSFEKTLSDEVKKGKNKIYRNKKEKITKEEEDELSIIEEPINFENFNENYKFARLFKHFIILFAQSPVEFKLKFIFAEYLDQFGIDFEKKDKVEIMKNHFLYFCHVFYLLGFISRKRTKNDVFIKNYFQMTNFFNK